MQTWYFKSFNSPTARRKQRSTPGKPQLLSVLTAAVITATLLLVHFSWTLNKGAICSKTAGDVPLTDREARIAAEFDKMPSPLVALLHYATSPMTPQQSTSEIRVAFDVLQSLAPCDFLVFGLGHDSLMWDSFNPRGKTLFLEEDMLWTRSALQRFPILRAHNVNYPTRLSEADVLISSYKEECWPSPSASMKLKGNTQCKLALSNLPDEVYGSDWDVIMIDAPRGYFAEAPGRMGVIYSAAIMARGRRRSGVTHVFLHDVDRKVEKRYAEKFLCMKYKVSGVGRLWHFVIPPALDSSHPVRDFCK